MGVDFGSRNSFTNLGSFAKVTIPEKSVIPCFDYEHFHLAVYSRL